MEGVSRRALSFPPRDPVGYSGIITANLARVSRRTSIVPAALVLSAAAGVSLFAQKPASAVTAADYSRAEKMLAPTLAGLVVDGSMTPTWLPGGRFWYRTTLVDGSTETILVDPAGMARTVSTPAVSACAGRVLAGRRLIAGVTLTRERRVVTTRCSRCLT
jgi:hypothetical protein